MDNGKRLPLFACVWIILVNSLMADGLAAKSTETKSLLNGEELGDEQQNKTTKELSQEQPQEPELLQEPEQHQESKPSQQPEVHQEPQLVEEPKVHQEPEVHQEPQLPQEPKVHQEPEVHQEPQLPQEPKVHQEPEVHQEPQLPQEPKVHQEPEVHQEPQLAEEPKVHQEPQLPQEPEVRQEPQSPQEPPLGGVNEPPAILVPLVRPVIHHAEPIPVPSWMGTPTPFCSKRFSCEDRCWTDTNPRPRAACRCDSPCMYLGDCCQDYFKLCLNLTDGAETEKYLDENKVLMTLPPSGPALNRESDVYMFKNYGVCESRPVLNENNARDQRTFWTVGKCPRSYRDKALPDYPGVRELCEGTSADKALSFPVSHRWNAKLVFRNIFCALCHDIELRDVLFWPVTMYCRHPGTGSVTSYLKLNNVINHHLGCMDSLIAAPPDIRQLTSCEYMTNSKRCPEQSDDARPGVPVHILLQKTLCDVYLQPVIVEAVQYANTHCAACNNVTISPVHFLTCPMDVFSVGMYEVPLSASLTFWNGRLEVSSNTMTVITSPTSPALFVSAWSTFRESRHEKCWAAKENARLEFFSFCKGFQCPNVVPPPRKYLTGDHRICSVRKYRFAGDYGSVFPSHDDKSLVNMTIEAPKQDLSSLLDKVFKVIDDVMKLHVVNKKSHDFRLREAKILPGDRYLLTLSWSTDEGYVTILQMTDIFQHRFYKELSSPLSKDKNHCVTTLTNFHRPREMCRLGDILEYRNVNLFPFRYEALFLLEDLRCFLDLERVGFRTVYDGERHGLGRVPDFVAEVLLCKSSQIEANCGKLPKSSQHVKKVQGSETNLTADDPQRIVDTDRPTEHSVRDDNEMFRRICYSLCALHQFLLIIRCVWMLLRKSKFTHSRTWYLIHLIIGIDFMLLMIIYLVAPDVDESGKIVMGALSHFCWLCLGSMTVVYLLHRVLEDDASIHSHTGSDEDGSSPRIRFSIPVLKTLFPIISLLVGICAVIDVEDVKGIEIGYSHKRGRIFWISTRTAFLLTFVLPCAIFFLVVYVVRSIPCFQTKKSDGGDSVHNPSASKLVLYAKAGSLFDVVFLLLFVIVSVDYFEDAHPYLWTLLFCLTSCVFCVWHGRVIWGQDRRCPPTVKAREYMDCSPDPGMTMSNVL